MPPAYEVLLLNTAIPQIQAAQSGDTYVVPRDISFSAKALIGYTDYSGVGANGLAVAGNVGIGTSSPADSQSFGKALDISSASYGGALYIRSSASASTFGYMGYDYTALATTIAAYGTSTKLQFNAGTGAVKMTLDSSGNLGLGVTPSAWSGFRALQVGGATSIWSSTSGAGSSFYSNNVYFNGSNRIRINAGYATEYIQDSSSGAHIWFQAASGTAGSTISFTQAMTLDASGNLGVANTSPSSYNGSADNLVIGSSGSNGMTIVSGSANAGYIMFADGTVGQQAYEGQITYDHASNFMAFNTSGTERARITSGGDFYFGVAGTNSGVVYIQTGTGTGGRIIDAIDALGGRYFEVQTDGDVYNTNGTYGTISDAKMKTDIVDAGSQWADIKAIRFRKFKMINDPDQRVQLGVVAQELEQVSPGLVDEHTDRDGEGNDLGTTTKSVKTSVLLMKAAVALQEAMSRIETLEAKIAALEQGA